MDKSTTCTEKGKGLEGSILIDEKKIRGQLEELVRGSVEETLNGLLNAEADELCGARRYERTPERLDTRAGHYKRKLFTKTGQIEVRIPKLRSLPFETSIIQRYRRRECSVEEALVEMYLAGVSVRRVEDITEALWGVRVKPSTISDLNQKIYRRIDEWRTRQLEGRYPYVFLDGIWLKRSWGGEVSNVSILVALAVDKEGYRTILGACEGMKEDKASWLSFLRDLKERGLTGVRLFTSDKCLGLVEALGETFPEASWQRCIVHFYRDVFSVTLRGKMKLVAAMLKAIHAQEDRAAAQEKALAVVAKLKAMKLSRAAALVQKGYDETLTYYQFPSEHRRRIRTNNPLERIMREVRRRARAVGSFPDGNAALMLVSARLRYITGSKWGTKRYLNMDRLWEQEKEKADNAA
jgi:transposase-like protein